MLLKSRRNRCGHPAAPAALESFLAKRSAATDGKEFLSLIEDNRGCAYRKGTAQACLSHTSKPSARPLRLRIDSCRLTVADVYACLISCASLQQSASSVAAPIGSAMSRAFELALQLLGMVRLVFTRRGSRAQCELACAASSVVEDESDRGDVLFRRRVALSDGRVRT